MKDEKVHPGLQSGTTTAHLKVSHTPHYTMKPKVGPGLQCEPSKGEIMFQREPVSTAIYYFYIGNTSAQGGIYFKRGKYFNQIDINNNWIIKKLTWRETPLSNKVHAGVVLMPLRIVMAANVLNLQALGWALHMSYHLTESHVLAKPEVGLRAITPLDRWGHWGLQTRLRKFTWPFTWRARIWTFLSVWLRPCALPINTLPGNQPKLTQ